MPESDPTHNLDADPLTAEPSAGRGGDASDVKQDEMDDAESRKGTEHAFEEEDQAEREPGGPSEEAT